VIRNIIFDWSGTLVDDLPAVLQASNRVLTLSGRPPMSLAQFRAEFQLPFTKFYDKHTPEVPFEKLEEWFHTSFREAQGAVVELPHARDFLQFCRAAGLRTFLLSSVFTSHYEAQNRVIGFDVFLDKPYTAVHDKREKIHELLRENNLVPDETLFIGDMEHDIATARHGGVHSCAVLTGYNTLEQLRAARPDLIVENLGELKRGLLKHHFALKPLAPADEHQARRKFAGSAAARAPGRNGAQSERRRVRAGAGLHQLGGILPASAFCAAELYLPVRGETASGGFERRRPRVSMAHAQGCEEIEVEPADEDFDRGGGTEIQSGKSEAESESLISHG
jgi:HAD superfamily hydrolase (TIGR01549 family)